MQELTIKLAELTSKGKALMGEIRMLFRESVSLARKTQNLAENVCRASLRLTELQAEELYCELFDTERRADLIQKAKRVAARATEAIQTHQIEIEKKSGRLAAAQEELAAVLIQRRELQQQRKVTIQ